MNSRERFRKSLNHEEPDRVPIDAGQDVHNGLHEIAYRNLLKYLGDTDEISIYDKMQHLASVKESILNRLNVDTRYIWAGESSTYRRVVQNDSSWADEWGVVRKNFGLYDEAVYHPLKGCSIKDVMNYKFPDPVDSKRFEGIREKAKHLYETTGYALIGGNPATLNYLPSELIGFQEYMEKLMIEPEVIECLTDRVLEWTMMFFERYLDEIGEYIEMVWMGDDWGTQNAPIIDPSVFEEIFVPRYKKFTGFVKSKADVKIAIHSCGSVRWAMPHFIEAGIDVVHPLQGDAYEMDNPAELKEKFGKKLVFYSNIRNQSVLVNGTAEDVQNEARTKIANLAPGGGYIFSAGHNIQADVPPQNILKLYETAFKFGKYPIKKNLV